MKYVINKYSYIVEIYILAFFSIQLFEINVSIKSAFFEIAFFLHQLQVTYHHFFYRNRLIAALGQVTLVVQAQERSGTFLTVHHALQNGKPVLVIPSHPSLSCFRGNQILLQDGASPVYNWADIGLHLRTEIQFGAHQQELFSV